MTYEEFNAFCASLLATTHVVQWGGSDVWKVGPPPKGKVFAVGGWDDGSEPHITFKVSPLSFDMMRDEPGLRPAPLSRLTWVQVDPALCEARPV